MSWACPTCGLGLSGREEAVTIARRHHQGYCAPPDGPPPRCAKCDARLQWPDCIPPCPICDRHYCDHNLAQRGDGICGTCVIETS